jgi:hypothetical protein|nr:MAG TPA: hypothetical protein [Caudoviricetes sp.]
MITIKNTNESNGLFATIKVERNYFKGLNDISEVAKFISIKIENKEVGRYRSKCYNFILTDMEDVKRSEFFPEDWPEDLNDKLEQLTLLILWKLEDEEVNHYSGGHNSYFMDLEEAMEEEGWVIED